MMGFYDDIVSDAVAPPWLQQGAYQQGSGVGGRILQTWGKELDQIATRARQAAVVSMPGVGDPSAIPLLCADRLIVQGSSETTGQITARLTGAFDSWKTAGGDWGVLAQILGLFRGFTNGIPPGRIVGGGVGADSIRWSYWATTPPVITTPPLHTPPMGNWLWDFDVEYTGLGPSVSPWYRFWLILDSYGSYAWCTAAPAIGGGRLLGSGLAIGFNISPAIFVAMRTLLSNWQSAGAWCRWIIVNLNPTGTFYSPDLPNAEPDGTWGPPAKLQAGSPPVWVPSRDGNTRFVTGMAVGN